MTTFNDYATLVDDLQTANPDWRAGQAAYNTLRGLRPDLADAIDQREGLDPFNDDGRLDEFYAFVRDNWGPLPGPEGAS